MPRVRSLLWIDCTGGLLVGTIVLATSAWLSTLFALPVGFVILMGAANLAYGAFSFSLARRATRPRALLQLLATANIAWAVLCGVATVVFASEASPFGLAHLVVEGVYVGCLGLLEWRYLELLLSSSHGR